MSVPSSIPFSLLRLLSPNFYIRPNFLGLSIVIHGNWCTSRISMCNPLLAWLQHTLWSHIHVMDSFRLSLSVWSPLALTGRISMCNLLLAWLQHTLWTHIFVVDWYWGTTPRNLRWKFNGLALQDLTWNWVYIWGLIGSWPLNFRPNPVEPNLWISPWNFWGGSP